MNSNMIAIINLRNESPLRELNEKRPLATIPVGGKFRLIDFTLSNLVNAGVSQVGLLLSAQSRSVLDHIRSGKEWGLARKGDGLFYLPEEVEDVVHPTEGDVPAYYKNLMFVERGNKPYILLTGCDMVQNIDYDEVLHFHRRHNADVTLVYQKQKYEFNRSGYALNIGENDRVLDIESRETLAAGENLYQRGVLIDSKVFESCIRKAYTQGYNYLITDVLKRNVDRLRIFGYNYQGYAKRIDTIDSYFQVNMDLLDAKTWHDLFLKDKQHHIYTKIKDEAPAKYMEESHVSNSLVANGCIIEGRVENSILFRKVKVGKNAVIRNSIIMQHTVIGDDAQLDYVVCDKNAVVQPEAILSGAKDKPLCIGKCTVI
ncbi:glucose-1-phosphate adenylyltransferase subunit GlgD [uncultured Megasphaera sp.]|uniref:glucose-1-phosphate adenylyltransferase subunit GlgD n=1 Tax=uncultured Megasphaera sp. TaxID=165188 RepID=UPI002621C5D3|nr:glucose-1-phosphate adenylyltransferase subunit GlgD [uncultured Megasphaera sp.]